MAVNLTDALPYGGYYGRIIGIGMTPYGDVLVFNVLTARHEPAQSRHLEKIRTFNNDLVVNVVYHGDKKISDDQRALLEYPAIVLKRDLVAVSNGRHTWSVAQEGIPIQNGDTDTQLFNGLSYWSFENDPHNTPRIAGVCALRDQVASMGIVRKNGEGGTARSVYKFRCSPGTGRLITTYEGPITDPPLPSFTGDPIDVSIPWTHILDAAYALFYHKGLKDLMIGSVAMVIKKWEVETVTISRSSDGEICFDHSTDKRP